MRSDVARGGEEHSRDREERVGQCKQQAHNRNGREGGERRGNGQRRRQR